MALLLLEPLSACLWVAFDYEYGNAFPTLNYYVGFETGFGGRKLIGTIAHLLFGNHIGVAQIATMMMAAHVLMAGLFLWLVVRCLPRLDSRTLAHCGEHIR